jgi:integrator complex subunit 1
LKDPLSELVTKEGWPSESEKNLFAKLCMEVGLDEEALLYTMMMGLAKEIPLLPSETVELVEWWVRRSAALHNNTPLVLHKLEIIELLFRLTEYKHPDNITLPEGYILFEIAIA